MKFAVLFWLSMIAASSSVYAEFDLHEYSKSMMKASFINNETGDYKIKRTQADACGLGNVVKKLDQIYKPKLSDVYVNAYREHSGKEVGLEYLEAAILTEESDMTAHRFALVQIQEVLRITNSRVSFCGGLVEYFEGLGL